MTLTQEEKDHFLTHGWIKIPSAFTPSQASSITASVWTRLGMSPTDKSTWTRLRTNMPGHNTFDASLFAPRAWSAIVSLLGGDESRITLDSKLWRDSLIVNLGTAALENQPIPPRDLDGWHVDGDFFIHYLDSPEQALLVIPLFTDIEPSGGGTVVCPAAIPHIARHLYDHPEGVSPRMTPRGGDNFTTEKDLSWFCSVARSCADADADADADTDTEPDCFVEATGKTGDVYLLHPLMLHSASSNARRNVRIITNPRVALTEPFCFDRADGSEYSLVEQVTLRALGRERLEGWGIKGAREGVVPERVRIQERMRVEELRRLEEVKGEGKGGMESQGLGAAA